jgi:nucleotide-binding universal stress UspA family protein
MSSATASLPISAFVTPKLENILLATDFSECSKAALPYAHALARQYGSTVHVVHVASPEETGGTAPPTYSPAELRALRQHAEAQMEAFLEADSLAGVPYHASVECGPISDMITALIQQHDIDLIVIGTHGRRGVKKIVVGSVAEEIFRLSPCPVLTIGPEVKESGLAGGALTRILYATDFSSGSMQALPYAVSLAQQTGARLTLLHSVEDSSEVLWTYLNEAMAAVRQRLSELLPPTLSAALNADIVVACGPAANGILTVAETRHAGLIVMGAHRSARHASVTHLPWATASVVISRATCPVLTVRS